MLFIEDENSPTLRRKNDILNQAQEFADLKRQCEEALPYNAHKATLLSDRYVLYFYRRYGVAVCIKKHKQKGEQILGGGVR